MVRNYEKIVAWQRAHHLAIEIYRATEAFPPQERFGITSQLRRAAYSVPSNIVEGSARDTTRDYLRFLAIAWSSLKETEYFLLLARDLGYLAELQHGRLTKLVNDTCAPLHGLMKTIQKQERLKARS